MSQPRLTDFYCRRKKCSGGGGGGPLKAAKAATVSTRSRSSRSSRAAEDALLCSSSVRQEFVRVIDEAAGLSPRAADKEALGAGPRTPQRCPAAVAAAEVDLAAAVFSATGDHSTAKKRRHTGHSGAPLPEKSQRRTARKKLLLPPPPPAQPAISEDTSPSTPAPPVTPAPEAPPAQQAAEVCSTSDSSKSPQKSHTKSRSGKTLSGDELTALKSRLKKIKKQTAAAVSSAPPPSVPSSGSPAPASQNVAPARDLQSTVARAKELAAKAQARKEERELQGDSTPHTNSEDSSQPPAYQRYHSLAQAAPPGLSLPYRYKLLAEMFRSMETVVAMLYNRCETATFAKVKQGVQDMTHKRFEESHVGQIRTVFPEAYTFRQEKNIPTFSSSIKRNSYQLTMEPLGLSTDSEAARPLLSASRLLERRTAFHLKLLSVVKQHHQVFLSSLAPPLSVPEERLTRWHPRFPLDSVPDVQSSSLPQPPQTERVATAQEVLDRARAAITPKMEKALVSLVQKSEVGREQEPEAPPAAAPTPVPAGLRGVSQSLVERIRAKEAQKLQAAMTRIPAQEERLLMMSRLSELARILRNVFVAEKKPALIMEVACNRLVASYKSALSAGEMEKHVRLLAELAADWLSLHPIRKDVYLKLNKNMELSAVLERLNQRLRHEETL